MQFADRTRALSGSAIRELFHYTTQPGVISLAGGNPGAFALPAEEIADITNELMRGKGKQLLQYGQTEGYLPLREELLAYARRMLKTEISLPEMLVTTGSMQGLDLVCKAVLNPGDGVLCESPSFLGALQAFTGYQADIIPVSCDGEGMLVDELEGLMCLHRPKILYTIPTFQNPTGTTLSVERRAKVGALATRYEVLVVEDDPYRELRYAGSPLPTIQSYDKEWTVHLGSFSKLISPGLRVGFMAGPEALIRTCALFKQSSDVHTPTLNQAIVAEFLRRGLLLPHLQSIIPVYRKSLEAMLEGLEEIPQVRSYTRPDGGLFVFAQLQEGSDAMALLQACIAQKLAFVPGTHFYPQGGHENSFRLNFTGPDFSSTQRGMRILKACASQLH